MDEPAPTSPPKWDAWATVGFFILSVGLGIFLYFLAVLFSSGASANPVGVYICGFGPAVILSLGIILGVVAFIRDRPAVLYPSVAMVFSVIVFFVGFRLILV